MYQTDKGLILIFSKACNMQCKYCFEHYKQGSAVSLEALNNILNILSYREDITNITIFGGEALLAREELLFFLEKIYHFNITRKNKINTTLITNGTIYLKQLKGYKDFLSLQISLDGGPAIQNKYRPLSTANKNSYSLVIENLKNYYSDGLFITINGIISNPYLWEKSMSKFFKDVPKSIPSNFVKPYGDSLPFLKDLIYFTRILLKLRKFQHQLPYCKYYTSPSFPCQAGQTLLTIDMSDGTVHYCHEQLFTKDRENYKVGEITPQGFSVSPHLLEKVIERSSLDSYTLQFFPRQLGKYLIKKYMNISICPFRNKEITGRWDLIPFRFLCYIILYKFLGRK